MRQLVLSTIGAIALLAAGSATFQVQSTTLSGPASRAALVQELSPIEPVACGRTGGRCPPGLHWVCGPNGHCRCVPC